MAHDIDPGTLEERAGHRFAERRLLREALTHSSYVHEAGPEAGRHNERLEFLGDAVLQLQVSLLLVSLFPDLREGELSRLRAALVDEANLAWLAHSLALGEHLLLGKGEEKTGGRTRRSVLADAFEALAAAVYLDGGEAAASRFVARHFTDAARQRVGEAGRRDPKTELQEMVQKTSGTVPRYEAAGEEGPLHERVFLARVLVQGAVLGEGRGRTKKQAQKEAAVEALRRLVADSA